ncbi:MAG: histidinol-phosphate transaminase [Croceitalea sp.]|nr:histidinol-phosphate transaminase [Croceitalea sp.]NNL07910.1 histidinol-phosphate transaminase [Croceitalea sp.]
MGQQLKKAPFDIDKLIRDNVKNMKPYSSARDEFISQEGDMVYIDANENPFDNGLNRYPDPHQRAVKKVLSINKEISVDQILLGNGSDEVLDLIFRAFCEPNVDNVITMPPTYGMYGVLAATNAIANKDVLLLPNFEIDVDQVLQVVNEQTKLIFICSPNNPTGNSLEMGRIEILLNEFNGIVVIDEAYIDFAASESWVVRLSEFPNLIVTQTLSKAYGLAAIRLGICYASKTIVDVLKKIKPPYNVNELTQKQALDKLSKMTMVQNEINEILAHRTYLVNELAQVSCIKHIYKSDANFILVKVDDANLRYVQLLQQGIVVRNRSSQPLCDNTLRLTVGKQEENEKLIDALKNLI